MFKFDKETIQYLSELSRIECSPEEQEALLQDLQKILEYFEQLKELDTNNVSPCNQVLEDMSNVMREDKVGTTMPREVFLANSPSHTGGLIKVPPVLKSS